MGKTASESATNMLPLYRAQKARPCFHPPNTPPRNPNRTHAANPTITVTPARIAVLPAASGTELGAFIKTNVVTRSHLPTDGFKDDQGKAAALGDHLKHTPEIQGNGTSAAEFFPVIHTVFQQQRLR